MREKPIKQITPEERKRGWEHSQRVLRVIKSQYKANLGDPRTEVAKLRKIEKGFLERTLDNNEEGVSPTEAERNFWRNSDYRNRRLPKNFFNQLKFHDQDMTAYSLEGLDLSRVVIKDWHNENEFKPDLERDLYVYTGEVFFTTDTLGRDVDNCMKCERWNKEILDEESRRFGRGLVFKLGGVAIGYVKLKGERSFLCSRTVTDKDGKLLFVKGIVYSLDLRMDFFVCSELDINKKWHSINLEDMQKHWQDMDPRYKLRFRHMRFIRSKEVFDKLDWFNERFDEQPRNEK